MALIQLAVSFSDWYRIGCTNFALVAHLDRVRSRCRPASGYILDLRLHIPEAA